MILQIASDLRRVMHHIDADACRSFAASPMPERIRIAGDANTPADRMISRRASIRRRSPLVCTISTPVARLPSNAMRDTSASQMIVKIFALVGIASRKRGRGGFAAAVADRHLPAAKALLLARR